MIEWLWIVGLIALVVGCGYGIWWILSNFFTAMFTGNIVLLLGTGILAYLGLGLLILGFVFGIVVAGGFIIGMVSDFIRRLSRRVK